MGLAKVPTKPESRRNLRALACVNNRMVVEVVHGSHEAVLELLVGGDADVAQIERVSLGRRPRRDLTGSHAWE